MAATFSVPALWRTQASAHRIYALQFASVRKPLQTWRRGAEGGCDPQWDLVGPGGAQPPCLGATFP